MAFEIVGLTFVSRIRAWDAKISVECHTSLLCLDENLVESSHRRLRAWKAAETGYKVHLWYRLCGDRAHLRIEEPGRETGAAFVPCFDTKAWKRTSQPALYTISKNLL